MFQVSLVVNGGCIVVAVVSACLISVDLAYWSSDNDQVCRVRPCGEQDTVKHTANCLFNNRYSIY